MNDNITDGSRLWEKIAAYVFGVVFVVLLIVIAIFFPYPTPFQLLVFRIVLALAAAGVAAVIPGFIRVTVPNYLRAGGAIAVFVVVYWFNPPSLLTTPAFPEHQGYLGNLQNHFNLIPDPDFKLTLLDKDLKDFWIDSVFVGETWGEVFRKICRDPAHSCLKCVPTSDAIKDEVSVQILGGRAALKNIGQGKRQRYVCG